MVSLAQRDFYQRNPAVKTALLPEEGAVLYHADTNQKKLLNDTALFIWKRLNGQTSIANIAIELSNHYDSVPINEIVNDISNFIENALKDGYVLSQRDISSKAKEWEEYPYINDSPESMDLAITGKCNLKCKHCFYADEMVARDDLNTEEWLSFIEELGRLPVKTITLTGGEVFTRSHLWELVDAIIANRMRYHILTNGTLITEKTLEAFSSGKRRQRLNSIQVSIDGSCPEVHDRFRCPGAFARALRALRLLKEAGFPVTVRVTVNRYNLDDLENIARLLLEEIGIDSFTTNDAMPMGSGRQNRQSIALTLPQQRKAMEVLVRISRRYDGRVMAMAGPLAKAKMYVEMEQARATGKSSTSWRMGYLSACGGMFNKLDVLHDGSIVPCHMLRVVLGKIGMDSIREIYKSHPILEALRKRCSIPMTQVPGCEDCEWAPFCNGGCPGLAYEMTGDFNLANPWDCYKRFVEEAGRWCLDKAYFSSLTRD